MSIAVSPLPVLAASSRSSGVGLTELIDVVGELVRRPEIWVPRIKFTESRYWTRLPAPLGVDVWLLTWLPDQGTELHDHGDSLAAFTVVRGGLTELRATADGRVERTDLKAGEIRSVATGVVHDVHNSQYEPAVSIHAYSPVLSRMTYYSLSDTGLTRTRVVNSDEPEESK